MPRLSVHRPHQISRRARPAAAAPPAGQPEDTTATTRVRQSLLAVAMVGAPVLITVGTFMAPGSGGSNKPSAQVVADFVKHRPQHVASGMVAAAGFALAIPAVIGLVQFARARGAALATIGGVLAGIGAAALAVNFYLISVIMGVLTTHPHDYGLAASVDHVGRHSVLGAVGFFVGIAFTVGIVLVGIALLRAGTVSRWLAALLIVGALLVAGPTGPWFGLPISLSFIALGVLRWQAVRADATAGPAPVTPAPPARQPGQSAPAPTSGASAG